MAVNRSRCRLTLYGRSLRLLQSTGKVGRHGRRTASKSPLARTGITSRCLQSAPFTFSISILRSCPPSLIQKVSGAPAGRRPAATWPPSPATTRSADNEQLTRSLRAVHEVCEKHNDVATTSLIETWIDQTERRTWFLSETIRNT